MKLKIDWMGLVTALVKAALPFLAGAVGGIAAFFNREGATNNKRRDKEWTNQSCSMKCACTRTA